MIRLATSQKGAIGMLTTRDRETTSRVRAGSWFARNWVIAALMIVSVVYGGAVTILHEDTLSPIDEVVYLDYTYKLWDQGVVHKGERFGDDVAHLVACEQVLPFGRLGQVCGSDAVDYGALPNGGFTTGEGYTPLYFWTVRIIGDPIHAVTGLSEVTSWRLSGVVWLAVTVLVLAALMRRFTLPDAVIGAIGLLFISSPYAWWTYTYISTDVSVVFFGALVLLCVVQARTGRWSAWWLLLLGLLAPLFKITNLLAFGFAVIYVVFDAIFHRRERDAAHPRQRPVAFLVPFALSVLLAAAVQIAWMRLVPMLAVSEVVVDQGITEPLTGSELVRLATSAVPGALTHNPFAGRSGSPIVDFVFIPLSWLAITFVVGAVLSVRRADVRAPLVWATAVACAAALPALALTMWLLTGTYFPLPSRYGAALIPAILVVGGFLFKNRPATLLVALYAGVLMVGGVAIAIQIGASY